jgi:hypothetical protein
MSLKFTYSMEIVKIDAKEYGITSTIAKDIESQFKPMLNKMVELETEYNEVIDMDLSDPSTAKKAKEVRLKYVKVRTGTEEIHKKQKEHYLNGGRFVDGWKNAQKFASQGKEEKLLEIEKHLEILEQKRIEGLQDVRSELVREYVDDTTIIKLGEMDEDVFQAYLTAKKTAYNDRIEAEKKAEEDRLKKLEEERLEQERKDKELEKLRKEAQEKEKALAAERLKLKEAEDKIKVEREEAAAKLKFEQEKAHKIRLDILAKLKAEQDEKDRLARIEEQKRIKEQEEQEAEALRLKALPTKTTLVNWVDSFELPETIDHEVTKEIQLKFDGFKNWALQQITKL